MLLSVTVLLLFVMVTFDTPATLIASATPPEEQAILTIPVPPSKVEEKKSIARVLFVSVNNLDDPEFTVITTGVLLFT